MELKSSSIDYARELFGINSYPGDLFNFFSKCNHIEMYRIFLFKEDIGKLSGFIGYYGDDYSIICINRCRPICHQNFTFAHELGHLFLHKGVFFTDTEKDLNTFTGREKDANAFAGELLYPNRYFLSDVKIIQEQRLLDEENIFSFAEYINLLCHKYFVSFELVLRKILYYVNDAGSYNSIRRKINKITNGVSNFDHDFYQVNPEHEYYQKYLYPYNIMRERLQHLLEVGNISPATYESIIDNFESIE